jgi:carboxyl-terminal processing protease
MQIRKRRSLLVLLLVLLLSFSVVGVSVAATSQDAWVKRLLDVYKIVEAQHLRGANLDTFMEGAIHGGLSTLNDPYTAYFNAEEWTAFLNSLDGSFSGIGAYLEESDPYVVISSPIKGSPAERAGLKPGDRLLEANGESLQGLTTEQVVTKVRGPAGTNVTLKVERPSEGRTFTVTITREVVSLPDLESKLLDGGIGYIALYTFGSNTDKQFWNAVADLKRQGARALVLDLRNNGGGYVDVAVSIAGGWVPEGEPVLTTKMRDGEDRELSPGGLINLPTAVLVNGGSASASEILAGAIQDWKAGTLVGEKTFGKGTVQQLLRLSDGAGLKVTIAEYLTAKGRRVDKIGLTPDVEVKAPEPAPEVLAPLKLEGKVIAPGHAGLNVLRLQQKLKFLGYQPEETGWFGHLTERALEAFARAEGLNPVPVADEAIVTRLNQAVVAKVAAVQKQDVQLETAVNLLKGELK